MSVIRARARIPIMHGTSEDWKQANPILLEGELGYNTTTNQVKIGNGVDTFDRLKYLVNPTPELEIATKDKLGGVKVGENLSITPDGVLSAKAGSSGSGEQWELITPIGETLDEKGRVVLQEATPTKLFKFDKTYKKIKIVMEVLGTDKSESTDSMSYLANLNEFPPTSLPEDATMLGGDWQRSLKEGWHFVIIEIEPKANGRCFTCTTTIPIMGDSMCNVGISFDYAGKQIVQGVKDEWVLHKYDGSTNPSTFTLFEMAGIHSFLFSAFGTTKGYAKGSKFTFVGVE